MLELPVADADRVRDVLALSSILARKVLTGGRLIIVTFACWSLAFGLVHDSRVGSDANNCDEGNVCVGKRVDDNNVLVLVDLCGSAVRLKESNVHVCLRTCDFVRLEGCLSM